MSRNNKDCIVVIPTHKGDMTPEEERSFRNTLEVLSEWPIALVIPENASPDYYEKMRARDGLNFQIMIVSSDWLGSLERYNRMASSVDFYKMFEDYKYLLICHLDAWVFRDELQMWIDKGYHYIGAPWFLLRDHSSWVSPGESSIPLSRLMYPQGGNGGVCLRNIEKTIELLSGHKPKYNPGLFCKSVWYYLKNRQYKLLKIYIRECREAIRDAAAFQKSNNIYEDRMFCMFYSLIDRNYRVAPASEELFFCTEVYSDEILKTKLKWQLPFAMHNYQKYLPTPDSIDEYRNDKPRDDYSKNIMNSNIKRGTKQGAPLVTVVTATYNLIQDGREEVFRQCVESIHQQTYKNIEHIIIDGNSSDGSLEIIQEYVDKGWCVCFSEPDEGLWDALYKGHQRAKGQFVNYMNSDDYFCRTDAIEIAVNSIMRNDADWFFSGGNIIREDGTSYPFPTSLYGVFSCLGILHQTMLVRTDVLRAINPFHTNHTTRENYLMMLLIVNQFKHAYSRDKLVHYREGGAGSKTYGGSNITKTKNDFGEYFYRNVGYFWGMTFEECCSMFSWECFRLNGVLYSYRLSNKLQIRGLRYAFRIKLLIFIYKNLRAILTGKLKGIINRIR